MASIPQPLTFTMLKHELGAAYMAPFLAASGGDEARAVALHRWNSDVGAAFHRPLELVEVAIRNRTDAALKGQFGSHWWHASAFRGQATHVTRRALEEAERHAGAKDRTGHADVVAEITFGTWVAILRPRFFDLMWRHHKQAVFPNHRFMAFSTISAKADGILRLRNAIGHHEPLLDMDLDGLHDDVLEVLGWMSAPMRAQAVTVSFVPTVLAGRP